MLFESFVTIAPQRFAAWHSGGYNFADYQLGAHNYQYTTKVDAG